MRVPFAVLTILASLAVAVPVYAQAPTPVPKRVRDTYSCNDKKTKITYDDAKSRAFLTYAAKRIVLARQPAPSERHYVSARYNLDWHVKGDTAVLSSLDPKTGAPLSTLAECTLIKK